MLLEAFASAVAVIGSDSGEIPHVIGDSGLVVGERDEAGWVAALDELLTDAPRRLQLGAAGLERARREFAWPAIARRHLEFFTELL
jgi:glycosyltransferase involved in cell wall biosynthesis